MRASPTSIIRWANPESITGSCQVLASRFRDGRRGPYDPIVPDAPAYITSAPRLIGRGDALREVLTLAASRPGVIVIAGEPGVGRARMAREAAARLALNGAVVIGAEGDGPAAERLRAAMTGAGHDPDPARAARLRPRLLYTSPSPRDRTRTRMEAVA